jgi:hypothetical protein
VSRVENANKRRSMHAKYYNVHDFKCSSAGLVYPASKP